MPVTIDTLPPEILSKIIGFVKIGLESAIKPSALPSGFPNMERQYPSLLLWKDRLDGVEVWAIREGFQLSLCPIGQVLEIEPFRVTRIEDGEDDGSIEEALT